MQHLGLLVTGLIAMGLLFTALKWPGGLEVTFSQRAATSHASKVYYALLFLFTLPLLFLFFVTWLVPNRSLPEAFLWFAAISAIFQIACTWVPEEGGKKTVLHRFLTGISGVTLLPLVGMIALSTEVSLVVKTIAWISLLAMVGLLAIALHNPRGYRYALLLQIGYYTVFFVVVTLATYS